MDKAERIDAENRFVENPEACLFIDAPSSILWDRYSTTTLARHLYRLWYGSDPRSDLLAGECGPHCHNPRHRVVKGPFSGESPERRAS